MTLKEIASFGGGTVLLLLTVIQIAPIKIDPWSAILGWIGKALNKELTEKVDRIQTQVNTMQAESRENHAKDCRVRILRFSDEVYMGQNHSQEHYKQVLGDIHHYDAYCIQHPDFENSIAVAAIDLIKESYSRHLRNHDFLQ